MKKINFESFLIAGDVARKHCTKVDCREEFANTIHMNGYGIAACSLALKIYQSSGEIEYTDEEVNLMQACANSYCKAFFVDALNRAVECQPEILTDNK